MRWISRDIIEACLDDKWRKSAESALQTLLKKPSIEEKKIYLSQPSASQIWRTFHEKLPASYKIKCWYCEAEEIRSDMPVDHFRPKGKVDECPHHEGYWWLAFHWENYRCTCTHCNSKRNLEDSSGGKGCHFPIFDETKRACSDKENISQERPAILDPLDPDDEPLLWFDADGFPVAAPWAKGEQSKKVENSITIFHLHARKIVNARNDIRIEIERAVKDLKSSDPDTVRRAKEKLRKMVMSTEKLSRAAVVYLSCHKHIDEVRAIISHGT